MAFHIASTNLVIELGLILWRFFTTGGRAMMGGGPDDLADHEQ